MDREATISVHDVLSAVAESSGTDLEELLCMYDCELTNHVSFKDSLIHILDRVF